MPTLTVRGRDFDIRLPNLIVRRQLVRAYLASVDGIADDAYPTLRVCAAALALCCPAITFELKLDASKAMRDLYAFGQDVLVALMERGWAEIDVLNALIGTVTDADTRTGGELWAALNEQLYPSQEAIVAAGKS